jgi:hypothetical protein
LQSVKFVGDEEESVSMRSGPLTLPSPGHSTNERRGNAMVASVPAGQGSDGDDRSLRRRSSQQSLPKRVREIVDNRMNDEASTWFKGPFLAIRYRIRFAAPSDGGIAQSERRTYSVQSARRDGPSGGGGRAQHGRQERHLQDQDHVAREVPRPAQLGHHRLRGLVGHSALPSIGYVALLHLCVALRAGFSGYQETIGREKFLVMALETDEATADNFGALWKDATEKNKGHFEHRSVEWLRTLI